MIKSGKVLFPRTGCEQLIDQIVHFGVEKHDDLADAFANLILSVITEPPMRPSFDWIDGDDDEYDDDDDDDDDGYIGIDLTRENGAFDPSSRRAIGC
jgi:hypothetical protein